VLVHLRARRRVAVPQFLDRLDVEHGGEVLVVLVLFDPLDHFFDHLDLLIVRFRGDFRHFRFSFSSGDAKLHIIRRSDVFLFSINYIFAGNTITYRRCIVTSFRFIKINHRIIVISSQLIVINARHIVIRSQFIVISSRLIVINAQHIVIRSQLIAISSRFIVINRRVETISRQLIVMWWELITIISRFERISWGVGIGKFRMMMMRGGGAREK
jgi:hypothetical protein